MSDFIDDRDALRDALAGIIGMTGPAGEAWYLLMSNPDFDEDYKLREWHSLQREKALKVARLLNEAAAAWDDFLTGSGKERVNPRD